MRDNRRREVVRRTATTLTVVALAAGPQLYSEYKKAEAADQALSARFDAETAAGTLALFNCTLLGATRQRDGTIRLTATYALNDARVMDLATNYSTVFLAGRWQHHRNIAPSSLKPQAFHLLTPNSWDASVAMPVVGMEGTTASFALDPSAIPAGPDSFDVTVTGPPVEVLNGKDTHTVSPVARCGSIARAALLS
ncbi:MAG TPA: hypothetical protein VLH86_03100 [Patescibacteria group bacterium]|nr:hypothetical protein [Patescibacteria group bacterium]